MITAEVKVDETDIVNVKLGQPAEVTIDALPNKTFKGKVTEIGQSAVGRTSLQPLSCVPIIPESRLSYWRRNLWINLKNSAAVSTKN